mgnify:CR=1 FL=1
MANYDPQPVVSANSKGFDFAPQTRVAAPFTESNMTWVEVENSTAADWAGFYLTYLADTGVSAPAGIFFVATGAASSEVRIATVPMTTSRSVPLIDIFIPIPIASGTRISVSATAEGGSSLRGQIIGVLSADFDAEPTYTAFECGPFNLAASAEYGKWVPVDPGGTTNTKGSYTEISQTSHTNNVLNGDSLANTYDYFGFMLNTNWNSAMGFAWTLADLATGAASSEAIYAADATLRHSVAEQSAYATPIMTKMSGAASGARISARSQCSITDATDRVIGVLLFGVR